MNAHREPVTLLSVLPTEPHALPAILQHRGISLSQMREARIHGVSQPAQGHNARKWQSCGLSCLPVLSYGESQNPCHPPQAQMHILRPALQWWLLHRRQPDREHCSQRDGLGGRGGATRKEEAPILHRNKKEEVT